MAGIAQNGLVFTVASLLRIETLKRKKKIEIYIQSIKYTCNLKWISP